MRATIHHQDGAISATCSDHDDFTVLAFRQGGDTVHIHLPKRMEAAAHMIVGAFNAHMDPKPRVISVQTGDPVDEVVIGFPSGGALDRDTAFTNIMKSWAGDFSPGPWIVWRGGAQPVANGTMVAVKYRNTPGDPEDIARAEAFYWHQGGKDGDIVSWRLAGEDEGPGTKYDRKRIVSASAIISLGCEGDGDHAIIDSDAAHSVGRRDLP